MSDYISRENTLKNIGLLNASVLMGNNKEVNNVIGGYNPTSFLVGMSYGLEQAQAMISSQPPLDEKKIIRKAFERVEERLEKEGKEIYREAKELQLSPFVPTGEKEILVRNAIRIVKEECKQAIDDITVECILREMGVDQTQPPHWIPQTYKSKAIHGGEFHDGYICSYCGKHSYSKKEICDGCGNEIKRRSKELCSEAEQLNNLKTQ